MMNLAGTAREVERARRDAPGLPIGVHLCLTVGSPVTTPERIPSLVDGEGRFLPRPGFLDRLKSISSEEVGREFRAQLEALFALGVTPDHLDSHHFVSYLTPGILEQTLRLAEEYRLCLRPPTGYDGVLSALFPGLPESAVSFLDREADAMIRHSKVKIADRLYLTFYDKTATLNNLFRILNGLPDGWSEIMCHPGLADSDLRGISDYAEERGYELSLLTESGLPGLLAQKGIQLSGYAQLNA
jgi:chitin disaccharide deacetylase